MRALGVVVMAMALPLFAYGWLAWAWKQGGFSGHTHWVLVGGALCLLVGGGAMVARRGWGAWFSLGVIALLGALAILDDFSRAVATLDPPDAMVDTGD